MNIRQVKDSDYEELTIIWNKVFPQDSYSAKELKYLDDSIAEPCQFLRLVAEDKHLLGSASYYQHAGMYHPKKFFMQLWVTPEQQKQGIGRQLYDALVKELSTLNPITLRVSVKENNTAALQFAQTRGFKETKRDWEAVLAAKDHKPESFETLELKAVSQGVVIKSLAEFEDKEAIGKQFFECFNLLRQDVPRSEPATALSWDFFKKNLLDAPDFYPEGTFLAFHKNEMIGLSQLWKGESSTDLYTGLTAVKREHRGKGVATALKLKALRLARNTNAGNIYTDNETNNVEMIAINEKLGFKRLPAMLSMLKTFKE